LLNALSCSVTPGTMFQLPPSLRQALVIGFFFSFKIPLCVSQDLHASGHVAGRFLCLRPSIATPECSVAFAVCNALVRKSPPVSFQDVPPGVAEFFLPPLSFRPSPMSPLPPTQTFHRNSICSSSFVFVFIQLGLASGFLCLYGAPSPVGVLSVYWVAMYPFSLPQSSFCPSLSGPSPLFVFSRNLFSWRIGCLPLINLSLECLPLLLRCHSVRLYPRF